MRMEDQIADANSIDIENDYELLYWTSQLKVTNDELREAVKEVGSQIDAVKVFLNKA
jgi:hypothetical protein